jgi:hypothetical protein
MGPSHGCGDARRGAERSRRCAEAQRLTRLLDTILDLTGLERGQADWSMASTDPAALIKLHHPVPIRLHRLAMVLDSDMQRARGIPEQSAGCGHGILVTDIEIQLPSSTRISLLSGIDVGDFQVGELRHAKPGPVRHPPVLPALQSGVTLIVY